MNLHRSQTSLPRVGAVGVARSKGTDWEFHTDVSLSAASDDTSGWIEMENSRQTVSGSATPIYRVIGGLPPSSLPPVPAPPAVAFPAAPAVVFEVQFSAVTTSNVNSFQLSGRYGAATWWTTPSFHTSPAAAVPHGDLGAWFAQGANWASGSFQMYYPATDFWAWYIRPTIRALISDTGPLPTIPGMPQPTVIDLSCSMTLIGRYEPS